jgi:trans-aconitate methyltransferase
MYASAYSKAKKLEYERARRAKNRVEKQEAQVLKPWLKKKYTQVYEEFITYYDRLQKAYPTVKNLAVTREFKQFVGMFCFTDYKRLIFFVF